MRATARDWNGTYQTLLKHVSTCSSDTYREVGENYNYTRMRTNQQTHCPKVKQTNIDSIQWCTIPR